ncbi:MAG: 3-dehydroquinate synthase, partial [Actinobacteria bacterium]|nr:3-dehydroquinate synthase [Actinomycetota bacterium]MCA1740010.1 3-dehydroquinate synthase [Actinomycetota bacterium]
MAPQPVRSDVTVAATAPYEVRVEPTLDLVDAVSAAIPRGTAVLLTDSVVGPLYASSVAGALKRAGWDLLDTVTVPAGESSKSLSVYERVVRELAAAGLPRGGTL